MYSNLREVYDTHTRARTLLICTYIYDQFASSYSNVCIYFISLIIAEEGVTCPEESTTSPNIDWYQVSGCYEAVAMCSTELTNIIGESCVCPMISNIVIFQLYVASQDKLEDSVIAQVSGWSLM